MDSHKLCTALYNMLEAYPPMTWDDIAVAFHEGDYIYFPDDSNSKEFNESRLKLNKIIDILIQQGKIMVSGPYNDIISLTVRTGLSYENRYNGTNKIAVTCGGNTK